MKHYYLLCGFLAMLITGCSSSANIETRDDITWNFSEQKRQEFTYTMYWFLPQPRRSSSSMQDILASMGIGQNNRELEYSPNNEIKLKLEDLAVYQLDIKLRQNGECNKGYKIVNTYWYSRSISLSGYCL
jgi:hypothetical protein